MKIFFFYIFIYIIIVKKSYNSKYEDVIESISELIYIYYMRGKSVQYSDARL